MTTAQYPYLVYLINYLNKNLSCRRETVRRFVSLNILLNHSRSFEMTTLS